MLDATLENKMNMVQEYSSLLSVPTTSSGFGFLLFTSVLFF